jgi:hypothetical protein
MVRTMREGPVATEEPVLGDDLASANVNRTYSLGATSLAIFTFTMIFLYPRYVSGEANPVLFQITLIVMGVATFSLVFASFHYYASSLPDRINDAERATYARRGDRFWLLGSTSLFLAPSLVLFSINLALVGAAWLGLWLVYLLFVRRTFPRVETTRQI